MHRNHAYIRRKVHDARRALDVVMGETMNCDALEPGDYIVKRMRDGIAAMHEANAALLDERAIDADGSPIPGQ